MRERMLAGEPYIADEPEIIADLDHAAQLMERFNSSPATDSRGRLAALRELLGELGEGTWIRPPFHCDYGWQIRIGPRGFVNYNAVFLDVAPITIGADVQIGPNAQLLTPTHPVEAEPRRNKWEAAKPITIGDNVWLGAGAIVLAGITVGENTVVGAGAVVTRDLPPNVVAVGNPARPVRQLD
ncbi:sugar O-acetyltransferase [Micromonospora phytophila]|uniref:sugar O-acetyltransferase n=1 Tax=Micromonospora phytophila TaxID=709888 RepID=UPI0035583CDA